MIQKTELLHAGIFSILATAFLFFLHHLPINQIFIDPFSEAIKNHDVMDISLSKFRDHKDPSLFDDKVFIINTEITDRNQIADAVTYLKKMNAGAIGVDLIFDTVHHTAADTQLHDAFNFEKLVIGFTFEEKSKNSNKSTIGIKSDPYFTAHAKQGYVNLASNDGFSVRAFEPFHEINGKYENSFAVQLASFIDPSVAKKAKERDNKKEWINFRRIQPGEINMVAPINSKRLTHYGYTSITQFLKDTASYPKGYFENKVVLLGFCGENDKSLSMNDRYFTPLNEKYHGRSIPDMHGVVVHANVISMLLDEDFIDEVSETVLYLFAFLIFYFNYLIFTKIARKKLFFMVPFVRVIQLIQFIILLSSCIIFLSIWNVKIGFILLITAVILSFELFEFYAHKLRNRIAQRINKLVKK